MNNTLNLSENINNVLNRMSTLKIDFLQPNLHKSQLAQYLEGIEDGIETLNLIKDMEPFFTGRVISYPIINLNDLGKQELLLSGTISRNVIYIHADINFLYKFDSHSILPGTHYFTNYFNSLSYTDKFTLIINSLSTVSIRIKEMIALYSEEDND